MNYLHYYILLSIILFSCKKEPKYIPDNVPYADKYISTLQIENYINKLYIDLIGREPLNTEMTKEVTFLKNNQLSIESRLIIIEKLQNDTSFIEGDTSYQKAYYHRLYDVLKIKMLEGVENDVLLERRGIYTNEYMGAVNSGDSLQAAITLKNIEEIDDILNISEDYRLKKVTLNNLFKRLIDNYVYDEINMNTFNFVNATFDDLFFRMPSQQEYDIAFEMIENNESGYLLGKTGTSKGDYLDIIVNTDEFYEGLIIWTYKSLLVRNPSPAETLKHITTLKINQNFQSLQQEIMKTDEFANF